MDPTTNLERQRELAAKIIALLDEQPEEPETFREHDERIADRNQHIADIANELAELVQALDEWRCKGGFDPYRPTPQLITRARQYVTESLNALHSWEEDEIEGDSNFILDLEGTIIECGNALDLILGPQPSAPTEG
jgi:hypothetical protein